MKAVSSLKLLVEGQVITGFDDVTFPEEEYGQQDVDANGEAVQFEVKPKYAPIVVSYIIPEDRPAFDWNKLKSGGGSLQAIFPNGVKWTYTGLTLLKIGSVKSDGKTKMVRAIELGASGKVEE